jgi:hypothetical protein
MKHLAILAVLGLVGCAAGASPSLAPSTPQTALLRPHSVSAPTAYVETSAGLEVFAPPYGSFTTLPAGRFAAGGGSVFIAGKQRVVAYTGGSPSAIIPVPGDVTWIAYGAKGVLLVVASQSLFAFAPPYREGRVVTDHHVQATMPFFAMDTAGRLTFGGVGGTWTTSPPYTTVVQVLAKAPHVRSAEVDPTTSVAYYGPHGYAFPYKPDAQPAWTADETQGDFAGFAVCQGSSATVANGGVMVYTAAQQAYSNGYPEGCAQTGPAFVYTPATSTDYVASIPGLFHAAVDGSGNVYGTTTGGSTGTAFGTLVEYAPPYTTPVSLGVLGGSPSDVLVP